MKSFSFIGSRVTFLSSLQVCDLHQGRTYVFRVRAVNASGVGRPSDTSEPVLVEARPGETRPLSKALHQGHRSRAQNQGHLGN